MPYQPKEFPVTQVLELACAAQRINGEYLKMDAVLFDDDYKQVGKKIANKMLMQLTLDTVKWNGDMSEHPPLLRVSQEDKEQAAEIQKYFRRLMFAAIEGDNEFQTSINSILSGETVKENMFGYVACLPSVYKKDHAKNAMVKWARTVDQEYLADEGSTLFDLDCEIISSVKSKNFEGYNIDAIISNKWVSWVSKNDLKLGACVIIKAKVKGHHDHWLHKNHVTRLNYVKAAQ